MSTEQFDNGNEILGFVNAIFTAVGVILGLWLAGWRINIANFKQSLGSISLDKDLMGYFVAWSPLIWDIWPFCTPLAVRPRVPTIFAMIEAGDLGLFSSSMFSSMPAHYSRVSWRPVYEAFFREYVWSCEIPGNRYFGLLGHDDEDKHHDLLRFVEQARRDVAMTKWQVGRKKNTCCSWFHQQRTATSLWWLDHFPSLLHLLSRSVNYSKKGVPEISLLADNIEEVDPHLLYYRWNIHQDQQGGDIEWPVAPNTLGPLLVRSILLPMNSIAKPEWRMNHNELWIHKDKPCIETFEGELAALSVVLGIIRPHAKQPSKPDAKEASEPDWRGAFGTVLVSGKSGHFNHMRLVHSQRNQKDILGGGSGYSTLFAKHMACGCLPFLMEFSENQLIVHTIIVPENWSTNPTQRRPAGISGSQRDPVPLGVQYLLSLHSSILSIQTYDCHPNGQVSKSAWMDDDDESSEPHVFRTIWPEVVARIAFGGLVPVATDHLVKAVASAVQTKKDSKAERDAIFTLMLAIQRHAEKKVEEVVAPVKNPAEGKATEQRYITPFGDAIFRHIGAKQRRASTKANKGTSTENLAEGKAPKERTIPLFGKRLERNDPFVRSILPDTASWFTDKAQKTAGIAELLSRYTVVLEYLIARLDEPTQPTVQERPSMVMEVYKGCVQKIREGQVAKEIEDFWDKIKKVPEEDNFWRDICESRENDDKKTVIADVVKVALIIIRAWTAVVQQVSWDKTEDIDSSTGESKREPRKKESKYWPPQLEEISYVSAWS